MTSCTIRYRLDGPGPAAYLVECGDEYRIYARGVLGGTISATHLLGLVASRGSRWVPASGEIPLTAAMGAEFARSAGMTMPLDLVGVADSSAEAHHSF